MTPGEGKTRVTEYFETKIFLEQIAMERGQYCYEYLKKQEERMAKLEKVREAAEKALDLLNEFDDNPAYAKEALDVLDNCLVVLR